MVSLLRDYRVHHSSPEGILVQLSDQSGFGRLTKETLGGDKLADRLLKYFSTREYIPAELLHRRDEEGYQLFTVLLHRLWSDIWTYPTAVQKLAVNLLRKHIMVGLGSTTAAKIVKATEKGTVLSFPPHWTALAILEEASRYCSESSNTVEVRILDYDVENNVVHVTAKPEVVERTPLDPSLASVALSYLQAGSTVRARVLLSTTDEGVAVVEIPLVLRDSAASNEKGGEKENDSERVIPCSLLGYCIYAWPEDKDPASSEKPKAPVVGSYIDVVVEFSPPLAALREVMPFFIVSQRKIFAHLPPVRSALYKLKYSAGQSADFEHDPARGLRGYLPWREAERRLRCEMDASSSDDDEDPEERREAKLSRRKYEEAVDAYERAMETTAPTSPEEFNRLLLGNPNSSYIWTQYMAYHVGLQQYEQARLVAEKALKTINMRETDQLLNIWVAYLNIENLYGTTESLNSVFRRALQRQLKPLELYERLADIYSVSQKDEPLLDLCKKMVSQFRAEQRVWQRLGVVLVQQKKRDQLKKMLKEMAGVLKRDQQALVIVHIAVHEYKKGSAENGRALLEGLVSKMPKKADVWSTYIDQEIGLMNRGSSDASIVQIRSVFNRAVATNFSAAVMQQLLSRFLNFEKTFGTEADVEKVKETARTYVQNKVHSISDATSATTASAPP